MRPTSTHPTSRSTSAQPSFDGRTLPLRTPPVASTSAPRFGGRADRHEGPGRARSQAPRRGAQAEAPVASPTDTSPIRYPEGAFEGFDERTVRICAALTGRLAPVTTSDFRRPQANAVLTGLLERPRNQAEANLLIQAFTDLDNSGHVADHVATEIVDALGRGLFARHGEPLYRPRIRSEAAPPQEELVEWVIELILGDTLPAGSQADSGGPQSTGVQPGSSALNAFVAEMQLMFDRHPETAARLESLNFRSFDPLPPTDRTVPMNAALAALPQGEATALPQGEATAPPRQDRDQTNRQPDSTGRRRVFSRIARWFRRRNPPPP